ncbi:FUSC family protein [Pedobacter alpinus]|uniref:FUSC family membrane protein n=1 Tax=Pedobacter alpinus TaxID=1590643 RepID=A0ABW5TU84_9SPHI
MKQHNPIDDFKNFMYTQYFSDGVKITLGVLLPAFTFFHLDFLEIGITLSLGAMCVSIADSPGPWLHRKNGMTYTLFFIFLTALLTALINSNIYLIAIEIFVLCFLFSMFYVYGARAASVGTAALLIMVLNIIPGKTSLKPFEHSFLILGGGIWYFLLSTFFSTIRPYRYAQQTLGESISEIADYMRLRARFYGNEVTVEENFKDLVNQQVKVNELQDNAREALFKTRELMNESTNAGRLMIQIFVDMVDLFEQTMATNNDYNTIRERFKDSDILIAFAETIDKIADEIEYIGFCLIHQEKPQKHALTLKDLDDLKHKIDALEAKGISVLILKKILINLRNIFNRITDVYNYFSKETSELRTSSTPAELSRFVNHQSFDWKIFKNNLNFKSSVFKYALRVAIVCLIGFFVGQAFSLGQHSYWIILTILVIMKPGFSSTKQRNYERVIGTILGGIIGAVILVFIKDETVRFIFMLVFMLITYSFIRIKYFVGVIFMTPFILILFSFINVDDSATVIASERILDTLIGSFLAFISSYILFPDWESAQFRKFLPKMLKANLSYLEHIILRQSLLPISVTEYRLARKEVYVNTANLAAAFQRMMNEPKRKQHKIKEVHKFVVLNHILSSYLANLSASFLENSATINSEQLKLIRKSRFYLEEAIEKIDSDLEGSTKTKLHIHLSDKKAESEITEQLELITKVSADLSKISERI